MQDIRTVIDVGNWYIKWVVFAEEDWRKIVLAKDMVKTQWMRKGRIIDVNELWKTILSVIDSFEKKLWEGLIDSVVVWISHPKMLIKRVREQKRLITGVVEPEDISHFDKIIEDLEEEPNYEIIKTIPITWIIDEDIKVKEPLGMRGRKLELIADIFMVPHSFYNSLIETFELIWIDIDDVIPNILWGVEASLDVETKDLGCLLIDIGNNQTTFVVYEEMEPLAYGVLPYWGEDVTKDISIGLQIDIKEAEKIKREKWIILYEDNIDEDEQIDIKFLSEVIAARYEDIFEKIKKVLEGIDRDWKLAGGVYLIWWGSKIKNLDKLTKEFFKLPAFYWREKQLMFGELSSNLQFINLLWDYIWFEKYGQEWWAWFNFNISFDWLKKIVEFFKKIF